MPSGKTESKVNKRVLISGADGLIGQAITSCLEQLNCSVITLSRQPYKGAIFWQPEAGELSKTALEKHPCQAVIHLAGEPIAQRWRPETKQRIYNSRVYGTELLCERLAALPHPPKVLIAASGIGYYGCVAHEPCGENAPLGKGFLATLCEAWEGATAPARNAGIRVVNLRLGIVLSSKGGALAKLLRPMRFGLGGPVGKGDQYMSWIALKDVIGAMLHCLQHETLSGPVNAVAPHPLTNRALIKTLAKAIKRPAFFPFPTKAVEWIFGQMGKDTLLASQNIVPQKLLEANYRFRYPTLDSALKVCLEDA